MPTATTAVLKVEVIKKNGGCITLCGTVRKKGTVLFCDGLKWNQLLATYNQTVLTETVCAYSI